MHVHRDRIAEAGQHREVNRQMDQKHIKSRQDKGFTLLEALIALVVFSIALLGLAALYTKTLSLSHSSYLRTLASIQAMDLEERIRANPLADNGDYAESCNIGSLTAGDFATPLDPAALADEDLKDWCGNTLEQFGGVGGLLLSAEVVSASAPGTPASTPIWSVARSPVNYDIKIRWNERGLSDDNQQEIQAQEFIYRMRR